jgi:hypothetical protein
MVKVTFCNWCPDPHHPSPENHPDDQVEHVSSTIIQENEGLTYSPIQVRAMPEVYRRRMLFSVSERALLELLRMAQDRWFRVALWYPGHSRQPIRLPPAAILDGVRHDPGSRCFLLAICDPSFPILEEGQEIPWGGAIELTIATTPEVAELARELEAAHAAIHDLRAELEGTYKPPSVADDELGQTKHPDGEFVFGARARRAFRRRKLRTFADLCALSANDLLGMSNVGLTTLAEVRRVLAARGLYLRGEALTVE